MVVGSGVRVWMARFAFCGYLVERRREAGSVALQRHQQHPTCGARCTARCDPDSQTRLRCRWFKNRTNVVHTE
jgi:hypothetical protein